MPNFILGDHQNITLAIAPGPDKAGNPTTAPFDAGSVTAAFPETTNLVAVVSADQASVLVTAQGPLTTDDVLTISGTVNGAPVSVLFPMDVDAEASASITVTPGTPVENV